LHDLTGNAPARSVLLRLRAFRTIPGPFSALSARMFHWRDYPLALIACLIAAGCNYYHPRIRNPAPVEHKRLRPTIPDPNPNPAVGPNDGNSARPRDYQEPLPEPVRNRIYWDSTIWRR